MAWGAHERRLVQSIAGGAVASRAWERVLAAAAPAARGGECEYERERQLECGCQPRRYCRRKRRLRAVDRQVMSCANPA